MRAEDWLDVNKKKTPCFQLGHRLRNQPAVRLGKVRVFYPYMVSEFLTGTKLVNFWILVVYFI